MGHTDQLSFVFIFLFIVFFLLCSAPEAFTMSVQDVEKEVIRLLDQTEFIPQVKITQAENGRFVVELIFSIGDRWGRDGFVRDLAKTALTRIFVSKLPLAQGIVKVYCNHMEVIHLAIGMNQAKQMRLEDRSGPSEFFDRLRSCVRWGKRPEDRTYFIENRQIIKPSPVVSLPPGS
jgi:hypothetical protein